MKRAARTANSTRNVFGQPSWCIASDEVEAFVTRTGGHLGPVTFDRGGRKIQPYSIAPWWEAPDPKLPAILCVLRGDFFCLPFGGNSARWKGEQHPVHGETANAAWCFESRQDKGDLRYLHLSLRTRVRPGLVDKCIFLKPGQNVVYSQHTVSGMRGPIDLGHHAMLRFPDQPGSGVVSVSPFVYGQVFPEAFEKPEQGGYNSLKAGGEFDSLERVPMANGETADLTVYPSRRGFEDLVMLVGRAESQLAWTAVTFPRERFLWFALKDPKILRSTVLWISNGGRHYAPWSGRHVNVLGLEEVTANFHYGLAESAKPNPIAAKGYPTTVTLDPRRPLVVPYIMGIASIAPGFDRVSAIEPEKDGIVLCSRSGKTARAKVALDFLTSEGVWREAVARTRSES
jgi:hypothetical protein